MRPSVMFAPRCVIKLRKVVMRVVLDTNILLSALITRGTPPDQLYEEWRHGRFDLAPAERQLEELNRVSRRPFFWRDLNLARLGE